MMNLKPNAKIASSKPKKAAVAKLIAITITV